MAKYSFKKASIYSALGIVTGGLIGAWRAANHLNYGSFETFTEAFMHVATPGTVLAATLLSVAVGASIEFVNRYHKELDNEERQKENLEKLTPSQK